MSDALTPEEQAELNHRMQRAGPTIGVGNPDARRVEVPSDPNLIQAQAAKDTDAAIRNKKYSSWSDIFKTTPDTPSQKAQSQMAVGAALGSVNGMTPALAAPAKAVGRGARSIIDFIGGKLAGLAPEEAAAYKAAPRTVEALTAAPALRRQQFAERALGATSNRITSKAGALEEQLQSQLAGKGVPESDILPAQGWLNQGTERGSVSTPTNTSETVLRTSPQTHGGSLEQGASEASYANDPYGMTGSKLLKEEARATGPRVSAPRSWSETIPTNDRVNVPIRDSRLKPDLVTGEIPASDVYNQARKAGKEANFSQSSVDPIREAARSEEAGHAFSTLRGAVSKAAPEADATIGKLKGGIDAQHGISNGVNRPGSFIKSGADDTAAARQAADQVAGGTRLERTAQQYRAADTLRRTPSKLTEKAAQPVGKAMLRGSNAVSGPAAKAADISAFIGGHASTNLAPGMRAAGTKSPDDELTPAEQEELNNYLRQRR